MIKNERTLYWSSAPGVVWLGPWEAEIERYNPETAMLIPLSPMDDTEGVELIGFTPFSWDFDDFEAALASACGVEVDVEDWTE